MADSKEGREKQADDENRRQQERELSEARARGDEPEPPLESSSEIVEGDSARDAPTESPECHRRGCTDSAAFVALERYQEDTGHGAVESTAVLCREHAAEESPTNLDAAYADYVFRVEPLPRNRSG